MRAARGQPIRLRLIIAARSRRPVSLAVSGTDAPAWESETYSLDAYAGQTIQLRFRYYTDGGVSYRGWEVTDVTVANDPTDVSFGGADTGYLDPDAAWVQVDDGRIWWFPWAPDSGTLKEQLGVRMTVKSMNSTGMVPKVRGADTVK